MQTILPILFWSSLSLIAWAYAIYPAALLLAAGLVELRRNCDYLLRGIDWRLIPKKNLEELPFVSILVWVGDEENDLAGKISELAGLEYPGERLELMAGSNRPVDDFSEIIRGSKAPNLKLISLPGEKIGAAINEMVRKAEGKILVFSSMRSVLDPASINKLVQYFAYESVGCVIGELKASNGGEVKDIFARHEVILKYLENRLGAVSDASGDIYAIRADLWGLLPEDAVLTGFPMPLQVRQKGYRVIYDSKIAVSRRRAAVECEEFYGLAQLARSTSHAVRLNWRLLLPFHSLSALCYWSHRILRWLGPFLLILIFVSNLLLLRSAFYNLICVLQMCFYTLAFLGFLKANRLRNRLIFQVPYHFVYMNTALFWGFVRFVIGSQNVTREKTTR